MPMKKAHAVRFNANDFIIVTQILIASILYHLHSIPIHSFIHLESIFSLDLLIVLTFKVA